MAKAHPAAAVAAACPQTKGRGMLLWSWLSGFAARCVAGIRADDCGTTKAWTADDASSTDKKTTTVLGAILGMIAIYEMRLAGVSRRELVSRHSVKSPMERFTKRDGDCKSAKLRP